MCFETFGWGIYRASCFVSLGRVWRPRYNLHRGENPAQRTGGKIQDPGRGIHENRRGEAHRTGEEGTRRERTSHDDQGFNHDPVILEVLQMQKGSEEQGKEGKERQERKEGKAINFIFDSTLWCFFKSWCIFCGTSSGNLGLRKNWLIHI